MTVEKVKKAESEDSRAPSGHYQERRRLVCGSGQAPLLVVLNGKPVFRMPDISCLRNVNYILRDTLDQIDNLL